VQEGSKKIRHGRLRNPSQVKINLPHKLHFIYWLLQAEQRAKLSGKRKAQCWRDDFWPTAEKATSNAPMLGAQKLAFCAQIMRA